MEDKSSSLNSETQQAEIEHKILIAFEKVHQILRSLFWKKAKKVKLTPLQMQILIFLGNHDLKKSGVANLAKEFNLSKPTISEAVISLTNKGLIEKVKDDSDNRRHFFKLTEDGRSIVEDDIEFFSSPLKEVVGEIGKNEKRMLWQILAKIIYASNRKGLISTQRMCFNCKFYERRRGKGFCHLLNKPLNPESIRIDCPEFVES